MSPRLLIAPAVAGALLAAVAGCNQQSNVAAKPNTEAGQPDKANVNIGNALFVPKPLPPVNQQVAVAASEPMLVAAHTTWTDYGRADLPAMRDSRILFIGTELKPGDKVDPSRIFEYRDKKYRRLASGESVTANSTVMLLDDAEAFDKLEAAKIANESAKAILTKAELVKNQTKDAQERRENLHKMGQLSAIEFIQGNIEYARAEATEESQKAEVKKTAAELRTAQTNYSYYSVRTHIAGVVEKFTQLPGQSVKALETVLQVRNTETLRAEGMVAAGYRGRLKQGMAVTIEPTVEEAPSFRRKFHTQPITGVAVSGTAQPYIVSVSEDRTARVWDGRSDRETAIFNHLTAAVRSVACSPRGAPKQYCLTGAEDGVARLWDLGTPKSTSTPVRRLEGAHKGMISAVAFSPDGKTCATADSRDIALWDVEGGTLKYKLPQQHLGEITSLTFTPQAKLISAARDLTVRVWSLGQDGAKIDYTQEGRSGDVGRLGVSHDGRYFLFDSPETLRLMNVVDQRTEGVIEGVNEASKFATFAVFSHDNQLVMTGNQNEGRVSVWRTPTAGNRATELRQFVPRERMVNFTCAAVAPNDTEPFAVTGAKSGEIYVWRLPTEKELVKIPGVLTYIDQGVAAATHQVRVWAEFPNEKSQILVGTNVTIVIEPEQTK